MEHWGTLRHGLKQGKCTPGSQQWHKAKYKRISEKMLENLFHLLFLKLWKIKKQNQLPPKEIVLIPPGTNNPPTHCTASRLYVRNLLNPDSWGSARSQLSTAFLLWGQIGTIQTGICMRPQVALCWILWWKLGNGLTVLGVFRKHQYMLTVVTAAAIKPSR